MIIGICEFEGIAHVNISYVNVQTCGICILILKTEWDRWKKVNYKGNEHSWFRAKKRTQIDFGENIEEKTNKVA